MNVVLRRIDPNVPDPVESRRRAAGRLVRFVYATSIFGLLGFFVVYFGAPLVVLSGPGVVSAPRHVVSLPYLVQVRRMLIVAGAKVTAGQELAEVRSPEEDNIVATYLRSLADVASRSANIRLKSRVAQESLNAARSYMSLTEDVARRIEASPTAATMAYRIQILREQALARKAVASQEAEVAESATLLAELNAFRDRVQQHVDEVERDFGGGRILAPIDGIVSTELAYAGQSLVAGKPIAEILDPNDIFVDWFIPSTRLFDPKVGSKVFVLFGNRRLPGTVTEILPLSAVYSGAQPILGIRQATQIARIRFNRGTAPPALNSTVQIHMYYTDLARRIAGGLAWLFGFT